MTILLLFTFFYIVFSDAVNTRYTEFHFLIGDKFYDHITVNLTWAETGNALIYLENKSETQLDWVFSFVDGDIIEYWSTWVRVCKSDNEVDVFWQYVTMNSNTFSIPPYEAITGFLDLCFPAWYSGTYYWCIVYHPNISESDGNSLNTVPRKSIFLDVNVGLVDSLFRFKIYPSDRSNPKKKWLSWTILFYEKSNTEQAVLSRQIQTNSNWTWEFFASLPNWEYFIVFKGLAHLASYLSWFAIVWNAGIELDFTTWDNLFYTKPYGDDWYRYQIAGDLRNINWLYDWQINTNDIATLFSTGLCLFNTQIPVDQYHPCNLNGDSLVLMSDLWVIVANIMENWPFFQQAPLFWWF